MDMSRFTDRQDGATPRIPLNAEEWPTNAVDINTTLSRQICCFMTAMMRHTHVGTAVSACRVYHTLYFSVRLGRYILVYPANLSTL